MSLGDIFSKTMYNGHSVKRPLPNNEHKDRTNNPYFNMIKHAEELPAEDDYSEDSNADSVYYEH